MHARGEVLLWLLMPFSHAHEVGIKECGQVVQIILWNGLPRDPIPEQFVSAVATGLYHPVMLNLCNGLFHVMGVSSLTICVLYP